MKRFIRKTAAFLAVCILLSVVPAVLTDPFNVFHWRAVRNISAEPNKNYTKTKYIIANPERFDGFLFGSSRVGAIHVDKIPGRVYNMMYSEGTPYEHLDSLRAFLEAGIVPDTVYLGVDSRSYTIDGPSHMQEPLRASYRYLKQHPLEFLKMYFDGTQIRQYWEADLKETGIMGFEQYYDTGWIYDYGYNDGIDFEKVNASIGQCDRLEETLEEIRQIAALCRENGIRLVTFTNPLTPVTFRESVNRDYLVFLKALAEITDYYNFSGCSIVTENPKNFVDQSHYSAEVGDMMLEFFACGRRDEALEAQGFGMYVTKDNVDDLLRIIG